MDTPDSGSTITVGAEEWEIVDPLLFVGLRFWEDDLTEIEFNVFTNSAQRGLNLVYNDDIWQMALIAVHCDQRSQLVDDSECSFTDEEVIIVNPQAQVRELTTECEELEVSGQGTVSIEGTIVYETIVGRLFSRDERITRA